MWKHCDAYVVSMENPVVARVTLLTRGLPPLFRASLHL